MSLSHEIFNKVLIVSHLLAYAAAVVLFSPHLTVLAALLSFLPVLLILGFWRLKNPIDFLIPNLLILFSLGFFEFSKFGSCVEYLTNKFISEFGYAESVVFLRVYFLFFAFLIFYFPIAFLGALVNFWLDRDKSVLAGIFLILVLFVSLLQSLFSYAFVGWKGGYTVLVFSQILVVGNILMIFYKGKFE